MDLRRQFVLDYHSGLFTVTELANAYTISRKTAYKWIDRVEAHGADGLRDRARTPHSSPTETSPAIIAQLIRARTTYPDWSAGKLLTFLRRRHPTVTWPCRATAHVWLKRHGLVRVKPVRRRGLHLPSQLTSPQHANDLWTTDFKGEFRTGDHRYCYPLTLRDAASRFVLRCTALPSRRTEAVQPIFERAFREFGLPARIRSDNGGPFAGPGLARLSRLAVWWIRLGILPERITPGCPAQNGSHEQFHRVLKVRTALPAAPTMPRQQRRFDRLRHEYNTLRPHDALGGATPADHYRPSPRAFPHTLPDIDYPAGWLIRRVATTGQISWNNRPLFLTEALGSQWVAFEPIDDARYLLHFATLTLATFDERSHQLESAPR